jgi:hypothetical protein
LIVTKIGAVTSVKVVAVVVVARPRCVAGEGGCDPAGMLMDEVFYMHSAA